MRVSVGNFLFRTRNTLFPFLYLTLFLGQTSAVDAPTAMLVLGGLIVLAGQGIRILTVGLDYIVRGGRNRQVYADNLVQSGLFAHCRNPLYLGNLLLIIGFGVMANNLWYLAITMPVLFLAYTCIIAAEERYLEGRFGETYRQYCARTPRLLPRLTGLPQTLRTFSFHWRRVVVKEYSTLCITLLMLVALSARGLNTDPQDWMISGALALAVLLACLGVRMLKKSGKLSASSAR
ncbi:isoprenylcysteine carboxylmethyltransferase family protein [Citrobacter sp. R56]|uniref:methyltransferase family protein n=1 Tax=Citrobacter sp. R56 TaxID=1573676 RepID=UPI00193C4384|nr:isoprenylcysteine carboxylmethyltransferase family protein [Citrobacter sp. R56]QRG80779.1 isoprenylcysteine carboxylmethyltransferase family protein [Citrobacter sp. R56]